MNILPSLLSQIAVYWPPGVPDEFNRIVPGEPREVAVRWNYRLEDRVDNEGNKYVSSAEIFHEDAGVTLRGFFWLSTATVNDPVGTALAAIPDTIPTDNRVKDVQVIPDTELTEILYKAMV